MPVKKYKDIFKICLRCNKSFSTSSKYIKSKYCSHECNPVINKWSPLERFFFNITINENGCWIFKNIGKNGYGRIAINGQYELCHRFSYEFHIGPIPKGFLICHKCDVRSCCNPDHLFLGTHKDNMIDMIYKGRDKHAQGEKTPNSKLTNEQAWQIKVALHFGVRQIDLSYHYNVSFGAISGINHGRKWKHILI